MIRSCKASGDSINKAYKLSSRQSSLNSTKTFRYAQGSVDSCSWQWVSNSASEIQKSKNSGDYVQPGVFKIRTGICQYLQNNQMKKVLNEHCIIPTQLRNYGLWTTLTRKVKTSIHQKGENQHTSGLKPNPDIQSS